ncbi:MAG TPA: FAD-dependent monooxygenase [Candidatus Angelobacter sp.]|jgi:2-polyprenyl-6-methoxyphenol hydroxylase-like FAD-dependent oxidoreductase
MKSGIKKPILIAGGGIGGLSAAIALRQAGFDVEVYERASAIREVGAGVTLMSNALTALTCLGLDQRIRDAGDHLDRTEFQNTRGGIIKKVTFTEIERECGSPSIGVVRPELMATLHEAATDIPIHTNSRCVGYKQTRDEVVLRLEDGREIRGSLLIGADGVWSTIRAQVLNDGEPYYGGATSWRAVIESDPDDEILRGSVFIVLGHSTMRGGGWYVGRNQISWFFGINTPAGGVDEAGKLKSVLRKHLKGWSGPISRLLERTPEEKILRTDTYARNPVKKWGDVRVTLMGDAAHAMGNAIGQGAAQAIEDAVILADTLAATDDLIAGLRRYEDRRMPRTHLAQMATRASGSAPQLEKRYLAWYRDLKLRRVPEEVFINGWREVMTFRDGIAILQSRKSRADLAGYGKVEHFHA